MQKLGPGGGKDLVGDSEQISKKLGFLVVALFGREAVQGGPYSFIYSMFNAEPSSA